MGVEWDGVGGGDGVGVEWCGVVKPKSLMVVKDTFEGTSEMKGR